VYVMDYLKMVELVLLNIMHGQTLFNT